MCKQLGYDNVGSVGTEHGMLLDVEGFKQPALSLLKCTGSEATVDECVENDPSTHWDVENPECEYREQVLSCI